MTRAADANWKPATPEQAEYFREALTRVSIAGKYPIFDRLLEYVRAQEPNEFGVPARRMHSSTDWGILLICLEEMGIYSNSVNMGELMGVSKLSVKNWIVRMRDDFLCDIEFIPSPERVNHKWGQYKIYDWGVFDKSVYEPLRPYVKLCVSHWLKSKGINGSTSG